MNLDRDEDRQQRLSTYSQKYSSKDAYKHQLRVEAEAKCGDKIHKISTEIKGACDAGLKHCKVYLDAERTPLHSESQKWTMSAKIQTVAPEQLNGESQEEQEMSSKQTRMLVQIESQWGAERRSEMNIRVQAEPTKKTFWKPQSQQKWARFLNKIDLVAEYKLQSAQKHVVQRLYELLKSKMFWQMSVEDKRSSDGEQTVRATVVIDPITRRHANISIQTPTEVNISSIWAFLNLKTPHSKQTIKLTSTYLQRVRVQSYELPARMSPYSLQGRRSSNIRSFGQLISSVSNYGGAECKADDRRVETFDGVAYKTPSKSHSCWSVLSKDCSRDQPRFVVLMKKTEEEKKIKIITQDKTIELIAKNGQKPIVKIDGQQEENEQELQEQGIEQSYDQVYVRTSSVRVQFDGEEVKVKVRRFTIFLAFQSIHSFV